MYVCYENTHDSLLAEQCCIQLSSVAYLGQENIERIQARRCINRQPPTGLRLRAIPYLWPLSALKVASPLSDDCGEVETDGRLYGFAVIQ